MPASDFGEAVASLRNTDEALNGVHRDLEPGPPERPAVSASRTRQLRPVVS